MIDKRYKEENSHGNNINNFHQTSPYYNTTNDSPMDTNNKIPNKKQRDFKKNNRSKQHYNRVKSETNFYQYNQSIYTKNIKNRIQKVCKTYNNDDLKKQIILLNNCIDGLEKQMIKKDKEIFLLQNKLFINKQSQVEINQLYYILFYYQGKIKQMEKSISMFHQFMGNHANQQIKQGNFNQLIQNLTKNQEELSAQIQQTNFIKITIQEKYKKLQNKYLQTQRQLSQYKRKQNSPLYQYYINKQSSNGKLNRVLNALKMKNSEGTLQMKQKQLANGCLRQKLQSTEKQNELIHSEMKKLQQQLNKIKEENDKLKNQIEQKDLHITELFTNYMSAKKSLKNIELQRTKSQQLSTPNQKKNS